MNKTIVVKLPVVWLFAAAVLLAVVLLGTGAATSEKKEDSWAIAYAPQDSAYLNGRLIVLNQKSGNLYLIFSRNLSHHSSSISSGELHKIGNLKDAGAR